jgi:hypothetical protein
MRGHKQTPETKKKISETTAKSNYLKAKRKRVLCIQNGKIYDSTCSASKHLGLPRCNISGVCHGRLLSCGGMNFKFYDEK